MIYQDILQKREARGTQKGIQQGLQQGKRQEAASLVMRLLTRKVGNLDSVLQKRIQKLSLTRLESLGEALLGFSTLADLVT